jgi:phosphoesterase RecJ-like protein
MLDRFANFLDQHSKVLLTTHENPDGDGVGASIGLAHYLRARGREARIVVFPGLPENLKWLDPDHWVETYSASGAHADLAAWPDAWIIVDASEPTRLGAMYPAYQATTAVRSCLDHHMKTAPQGFDQEFTDSTASASGQMVFQMVRQRMATMPPTMVKALYASLVSDTGNFRFSNATAEVHRIAAELITLGAEPARTYQDLYNTDTPEKLKLFGRAFDGMQLLSDRRLAFVVVRKSDIEACGATHEDLDELVQAPMRLKGIEVSSLLYETADGLIKLSLRSKERVNVNAVCRQFGGGGHLLASGAKLKGTLEAAMEKVQAALLSQLEIDLA